MSHVEAFSSCPSSWENSPRNILTLTHWCFGCNLVLLLTRWQWGETGYRWMWFQGISGYSDCMNSSRSTTLLLIVPARLRQSKMFGQISQMIFTVCSWPSPDFCGFCNLFFIYFWHPLILKGFGGAWLWITQSTCSLGFDKHSFVCVWNRKGSTSPLKPFQPKRPFDVKWLRLHF